MDDKKPWPTLVLNGHCYLERVEQNGEPWGYRIMVAMPSVTGDRYVAVATVPSDALVRFLGPDSGLLPADFENDGPDAKRTIKGHVCVGGPYDGRRMPKGAAGPAKILRVPVRSPSEFKAFVGDPTDEHFDAPWYEGEYRLLEMHGPKPPGVELRELWWWIPPREWSRRSA